MMTLSFLRYSCFDDITTQAECDVYSYVMEAISTGVQILLLLRSTDIDDIFTFEVLMFW